MEKRKFERKKVEGELSGKMIMVDQLNILDLSMNGMRFRCGRRVDMNSVHRIKMDRKGLSLDLKGEVVRSTLCIEQRGEKAVTVYEVAITFKNLSQEAKKTLENLISLLGNG